MTSPIVLSTLNARYIHSAFGLRYLKANLGELESQCQILEFTIDGRPEDIVENILKLQPKIVGFGVYIWNVVETERVVGLLKAVAPEVVVVLGGPEVSYEYETQSLVELADHLITGWGELSFKELASDLLDGPGQSKKVISGVQAKLDQLVMPYGLYTDQDIANRVMYVEASRGCPFKCEFCLSALDKTAWPFDLDAFLEQMDRLYQRGARHFKFVDRTFNLKVKSSLRIMAFFLERMSDDLFLHFEVVPDHLPEQLKEMIAKFPAGSLQFEIGIQTFNPLVQSNISRRQNNEKAKENLSWIREQSDAYVHADLIFGLPGESLESFADSFNQLWELRPHEIQVGILKRLKGSPIIRHTTEYDLVFNPNPPFSIVSNSLVDFDTVQAIGRFARYWDLIGNSGRFTTVLPILLNKTISANRDIKEGAFHRFFMLSESLFNRTRQTHKIALLRLYDLVYEIGINDLNIKQDVLLPALRADFMASGLKSIPQALLNDSEIVRAVRSRNKQRSQHSSRQARHLSTG